MRFANCVATVLTVLAYATSPAGASIISGRYTFNVSMFSGAPTSTIPADPVFGRFDITFDTTSPNLTALPVSNLLINLSPVSSYSAQYVKGNLFPFGIQPVDEVSLVVVSGPTYFSLGINNASTAPTLYLAEFQTVTSGFDLAFSHNGTFSFAPATAMVPEPASIALFGTALVGLGLSRRRGVPTGASRVLEG